MTRARFMEELSRMLSDIPETERQEALEYYENYFDDAGPELEAQVLQELGSPGKIAAIIKADLKETDNRQYGEYTERGYRDSRIEEDCRMPVRYGERASEKNVHHTHTEAHPFYEEQKENSENYNRSWQDDAENRYGRYQRRNFGDRMRNRRKKNMSSRLILVIIALVLLSPLWGGILTAAAGVLIGIICVPIAIVIALGASAAAFLLSGIFVIILALAGMAGSISAAAGFLMIGIGFLLLALGILLLLATAASIKSTIRILVFLFRKATDFLSGILYRVKGGIV